MENLQEERPFVDGSTDAEAFQPQNIHPSYEIQTSFEELCLSPPLIFVKNTQVVNQLVDSIEAEKTPELSRKTVPVPSVVVPSVNYHEINQVFESGKAVEQVASNTHEKSQQAIKVKTGKLKGVKPNRIQLSVEEVQEPTRVSRYLSLIPNGSAEFIYHKQIISVNTNEFGDPTMLSHGNFGSVYSVVIKGPPAVSMAVKRIPFRTDENGSLSIYTELTTMEKIGCGITPYAVNYYCAMVDIVTGELCICMELMVTTIAKFYGAMHSFDRVPSNKLDLFVRRCVHDVTSGLHFLETKDVVHRDVKPANMLINNDAVIKLCDFGICGNLTDTESDFSVVVGTALYLPPNPKRCVIQGDMWGLGISLLEIANGEHPFADRTIHTLPVEILEWKPIVPPTISVDMQELILHLLKQEAKDRPRSYRDILIKPSICNMTETPSNDECDFVRRVIKKIPPTGSFNK